MRDSEYTFLDRITQISGAGEGIRFNQEISYRRLYQEAFVPLLLTCP
jgi:hypothetical protein